MEALLDKRCPRARVIALVTCSLNRCKVKTRELRSKSSMIWCGNVPVQWALMAHNQLYPFLTVSLDWNASATVAESLAAELLQAAFWLFVVWLCGNCQGDVYKFSFQSLYIPVSPLIYLSKTQAQPGVEPLCPAMGTIGAEVFGEIWPGYINVASNAAQPLLRPWTLLFLCITQH